MKAKHTGGHKARRDREHRKFLREKARNLFLEAAYLLTNPMVCVGGSEDPGALAMIAAADGIFRLAESDPEERILDSTIRLLGTQ